MFQLDDLKSYKRNDPTNLRTRIRQLPSQCLEAWDSARKLQLPPAYSQVKQIVILGMGGSAIGGNLLADFSSSLDCPPILVVREPNLPAYVDERTLVIASSYSGETLETLNNFESAIDRGARVLAITRGGSLGGRCQDVNLPILPIEFEGEPRSALGYSFLGPLAILENLKLIPDQSAALRHALVGMNQLIENLNEKTITLQNPAKQLAQKLFERIPIIYGVGITKAVARRWKTQLNENSEVWAAFDELPEVHHNAVMGYQYPEVIRESAFIVLLNPGGSDLNVDRWCNTTIQLLKQLGISHSVINAVGETPLEKILTSVVMGDYTSYFLAILQDIDPSPVPLIGQIKADLSAMD